jgi:hypothetical protein
MTHQRTQLEYTLFMAITLLYICTLAYLGVLHNLHLLCNGRAIRKESAYRNLLSDAHVQIMLIHLINYLHNRYSQCCETKTFIIILQIMQY